MSSNSMKIARNHRWIPSVLGALCIGFLAVGGAQASVETLSRFLEFDATQGLLAYEITLRNLASLPVSHVRLDSEPPALEGPLEISDLAKGQSIKRRFTFKLPEGKQRFHPRFLLAYTNYEGERIKESPDRPHILANAEFIHCDLETGRVDMRMTVVNPNAEPVIFMELRSENPRLDPPGPIELGDLKAGMSMSRDISLRIPPGERYFNPTFHFSYHAFHTRSTRIHRSFYTIIQPDLSRVAAALAERRAGGEASP